LKAGSCRSKWRIGEWREREESIRCRAVTQKYKGGEFIYERERSGIWESFEGKQRIVSAICSEIKNDNFGI